MAYTVTKNPDGSIKFSDTNSETIFNNPEFNLQNGVISVLSESGTWSTTLISSDFTSVDGNTETTITGWHNLLLDISANIPKGLTKAVTCFEGNVNVGDESPVIDLGMNQSVVLFGTADGFITVRLFVSHDGINFFDSGITYSCSGNPSPFYFNNTEINTRYVKFYVGTLTVAPTEIYLYTQSK